MKNLLVPDRDIRFTIAPKFAHQLCWVSSMDYQEDLSGILLRSWAAHRMGYRILRPLARVTFGVVTLWCCASVALVFGQDGNRSTARKEAGERIFKAACAACHGADGRGTSKEIAGFERPRTFPDFTACDQTTPEPDINWKDVITQGGRARGFSDIMPSFRAALTREQIDDLVAYLRSFCRDSRWPRGELNLPRAFVTEKAYPEDEVVLSTTFHGQGAPGGTSHIIHEQRFGIHNQIEVDVPVQFEDQNHAWYGGVGDTTLAVKRTLFSNLHSGSIFALQGGVILPTGSRTRGFGTGTTTFETFAAFDQLFRTNTFVQMQFGADLPRHADIAPQSLFFNTAIGQSIAADHGFGRVWSPMMEFVAARELVDNAKTNWDVVPQMQVTISKRQHIKADLGVRVPVTNTAGRNVQIVFYLLWDWQDGRLNEGWR
jgi:mono/diheme cytochrome c family protein